MVTLAASFGISVTSPQFASEAELWRIIQGAIANGHGVVFPYACAGDDGAPAWSRTSNGFTHWCLLFGYVTFSYAQLREPLNHVFMTTYGKYHEVSPYQLFKSNQGIQDWPRQKWVKLALWCKTLGSNENWRFDQTFWFSELNLRKDLREFATICQQRGYGLGLGTKDRMVLTVHDSRKPISDIPSQDALNKLVSKSVDLQAVKYTQTLSGQCVVVDGKQLPP